MSNTHLAGNSLSYICMEDDLLTLQGKNSKLQIYSINSVNYIGKNLK